MKRLLKGGRVVDPANGRDGSVRHPHRRGSHRPGGERFARRRRCRHRDPVGIRADAGAFRHARAPPRAGTGTQGNGCDRHGVSRCRRFHRRGVHAEHLAHQRQRRRDEIHPAEGGAGESRRASIQSARCRRAPTAISSPISPSCAMRAASAFPTTAGRSRPRS